MVKRIDIFHQVGAAFTWFGQHDERYTYQQAKCHEAVLRVTEEDLHPDADVSAQAVHFVNFFMDEIPSGMPKGMAKHIYVLPKEEHGKEGEVVQDEIERIIEESNEKEAA